jgi:hypothetical protein
LRLIKLFNYFLGELPRFSFIRPVTYAHFSACSCKSFISAIIFTSFASLFLHLPPIFDSRRFKVRDLLLHQGVGLNVGALNIARLHTLLGQGESDCQVLALLTQALIALVKLLTLFQHFAFLLLLGLKFLL